MDSHDGSDTLLRNYFQKSNKNETLRKAKLIRFLQSSVNGLSPTRYTMWRFFEEVISTTRISGPDFQEISNCSKEDIGVLTGKTSRNPFGLPAASMAQIMVACGIHLTALASLLENSVIAKHESQRNTQALARSSVSGEEKRSVVQAGLDALFVQLSASKNTEGKAPLSPEDDSRLRKYLDAVRGELREIQAEYLLD